MRIKRGGVYEWNMPEIMVEEDWSGAPLQNISHLPLTDIEFNPDFLSIEELSKDWQENERRRQEMRKKKQRNGIERDWWKRRL